MNFKKFISGVSALTIAASAFAGMAVTANAAATVTLVHTASTSCGSDKSIVTGTVDTELAHYNNEGSGTWQGYAFAEFSYSIPEGETITAATLTWKAKTTSAARNHSLYYLNAGVALNYDTIGGGSPSLLRYNGQKTSIVTEKFANTETKTTDVLAAINATASQGYIIFQWTNNAGGGDLYGKGSVDAPVLNITTVASSSASDYTVKYVDENGNDLKDAVTKNGVTGDPVVVTADDRADIRANNKKYIFDHDDSASKTIASDTVVTLTFREAATYSYSLSSNVGSYTASGSGFEGDTAYVPYPRFMNIDGTLYNAAATNQEYRKPILLSEDNISQTVDYTATETTGVVYYSEGEDATGLTGTGDGNAAVRCSMARGGYATSNATITTLPAGKYKIVMGAYGVAGTTFKAYKGAVAEENVIGTATTNTSASPSESEEFTLTGNTDIIIGQVGNAGSSPKVLDYIYIVKTGDYEEPTTEDAFTFTQPLSALQDLMMYVTRSSDHHTADPVAVSSFGSLDGTTVYSGTGDANLAIIFENIPESWGTLSVVLK